MKKLFSTIMVLSLFAIFINSAFAFGGDGICCQEEDSDCVLNNETYFDKYFKERDENGHNNCKSGPGNPNPQ